MLKRALDAASRGDCQNAGGKSEGMRHTAPRCWTWCGFAVPRRGLWGVCVCVCVCEANTLLHTSHSLTSSMLSYLPASSNSDRRLAEHMIFQTCAPPPPTPAGQQRRRPPPRRAHLVGAHDGRGAADRRTCTAAAGRAAGVHCSGVEVGGATCLAGFRFFIFGRNSNFW
eukprot:360322-Chlamydomonas_euryale.AAC.2